MNRFKQVFFEKPLTKTREYGIIPVYSIHASAPKSDRRRTELK